MIATLRAITILAFFWIVLDGEGANAQSVSNQELFSLAIKKNLEYAQRIKKTKNYHESTTERTKVNGLGNKSDQSTKTKSLVSLSFDCRLYEATSDAKSFLSTVDAIGKEYCFELQKKFSEPKWRLHRYAISDDPDLDMQELGFALSMRRPSRVDLALVFTPSIYAAHPCSRLYDFEKQPGFQLESTDENDDGSVVLNFVYLCSGFSDFKAKRAVTVPASTELTLDANNYYLPTKLVQVAEINGHTYRLESRVDREFKDGLVVREQHHSKTTISQTDFISEDQKTIEYDYSPIPESAFLLSAYEFPEPTELAKKGWKIPANVWLLIVGAVLIAVAVYAKMRSNKT